MLSKNQIKLITSLQQKKYRKQEQLFFVEGVKGVQELLDSNFELVELFTTNSELFSVDKSKVYTILENSLYAHRSEERQGKEKQERKNK
jgi:TrmH family RNA methyltransferase